MTPESLDGVPPGSGASDRQKEALRASMRRLRAAIPPEERSRLGALIEGGILGLPGVLEAETILLFYSFGTEVATAGMAERILASGKRLLLPYLEDDGSMEAAEVRPGDALERTPYGPREPGGRTPVDPEAVDVVVTPGLAFDRRGNRLGYGGGHYDRYLRRTSRDVVRIGVAFSLQIVERIPTGPTDERVHVIVTDREVLHVRPVQ